MDPKPFVNRKGQSNHFESNKHDISKNFGLNRKGSNQLDLDELFQFSAARQRAFERNAARQTGQPFAEFVPHRVFMNHIDSYHGRHLADYLADQVLGATKVELVTGEEGIHEEQFEEEIDELLREEPEKQRRNYEVIGTLDFVHNPEYRRTEDIHDILNAEDRDSFLSKILSCGFIIYDINTTLSCHPFQIEEATSVLEHIVQQLDDMEKTSPKAFKKYKECRTFILISTILTWAKTKPIDPEDPSLAFTEADFRKRKPHPNYKVHCEFEKRVIEYGKKFPNNLKTIVVGAGITYGHEEDVLHFLFKMAWMNTPELPLFMPGKNLVPLIHIDSLVSIVHLLMEQFPDGYRYLVAVEQSSTALKKIVTLIAKHLGSGKCVKVSKEEAFLYPHIKQRHYDMLTVNLNMEPRYIVENMDVKWSSELPFGENISKLISEFKKSRNLQPLKIFIHGPPASGKSFMARRLCEYYGVHYLNVKHVIEEGIQAVKDRINEIKMKQSQIEETVDGEKEKIDIEGDEEEEEIEEEEEEAEDLEGLTELLNEIEDNMNSNERNRLDDQYVIRFFKEKMLSNPCQNQGYIVDGYPKTMEQTRTLYEPGDDLEVVDEEMETNPQGGVESLYNAKIMPDFIECLDASDEFLIRRVILMPEIEAQGTHYLEEDMCRRLTEFRALNSENNTPLIFYDELDVHPMIYNVELDTHPQMETIFQAIIKHIGPPRNYGPEGAELEEITQREEEAKKQKAMGELKAKETEARKRAQERRNQMENWMLLKDQEKEMEEKALALLSMPLRHYLVKYIFPTLTRGLVEVARLRPDDPVDFLAEFLFRENPEGKMFQPNFETEAEELLQAVEDYRSSLFSKGDKEPQSEKESLSSVESVILDAVSNVTDIRAKCSHPSLASPSKKSEFLRKEDATNKKQSIEANESCKCSRLPSCPSASFSSSSCVYTPPSGSSCACPPTSTHCQCPL